MRKLHTKNTCTQWKKFQEIRVHLSDYILGKLLKGQPFLYDQILSCLLTLLRIVVTSVEEFLG